MAEGRIMVDRTATSRDRGCAAASSSAQPVAAGSATAFAVSTPSRPASRATQAGGHPDVEFHFAFDNSLFKDGELTLPDDNPCHCDDAQVITIHFPTGFIGNPHVVAEMHAGRVRPAANARSTPRSA